MKLTRVNKGDDAHLPCACVGGKEGWTRAPAPADGIVVCLDASDVWHTGIFITNAMLSQLGYTAVPCAELRDGPPYDQESSDETAP